MKSHQKTFETTLKQFEYHFNLSSVFDDFLTISLCAFGINPRTKLSYDEALYLETIGKYKDSKLIEEFPVLLACLIQEMEARIDSSTGWDVLGEFYEQNLIKKGLSQFFTPWHICTLMTECSYQAKQSSDDSTQPLHVLDPACGSGRMLLASSRVMGREHKYYGVDIDITCAKMTAVNLFLSGVFSSEAMCGNPLAKGDFTVSYATSFLPFGVFRIQDKERSRLWHKLQHSWKPIEKQPPPDLNATQYPQGSQLNIF